MPFFGPPRPSPDTRHRLLALSLIRSLETVAPGAAQAAIHTLEKSDNLEQAISEFRHSLANMISQQQHDLSTLQFELKIAESRISCLHQENDRLRDEPLRSELATEKTETAALTKRLATAEAELHSTRLALAASQRKTADLQVYITGQNRIIAQQQLRLNTLLGETPSAETPGDL